MAYLMTNTDFVNKAKEIATKYKTLYVMGCFGAPMTSTNRIRYSKHTSYNKRANRTKMIMAATSDTFGFDCVCLFKGILWGWNGDTSEIYGGAKYQSNGVPDIIADAFYKKCTNRSTDFRKIEVGELLWTNGHVGVYIGGGLAIECTPSWKNCVQVTTVGNIGTNPNYPVRKWKGHGKLPWIDYKMVVTKTIDELAREVLNGKWGSGADRRKRLTAAGYNYSAVQARVNELIYGKK